MNKFEVICRWDFEPLECAPVIFSGISLETGMYRYLISKEGWKAFIKLIIQKLRPSDKSKVFLKKFLKLHDYNTVKYYKCNRGEK